MFGEEALMFMNLQIPELPNYQTLTMIRRQPYYLKHSLIEE